MTAVVGLGQAVLPSFQRYPSPARDGNKWGWGQADSGEKGLGNTWEVWTLEGCLGVHY